VQANTFERCPKDARLERGDVGGNVGELRHWYKIEANMCGCATGLT
jgi:hypothetical protein